MEINPRQALPVDDQGAITSEQNRGMTAMESFRNSRFGRLVTAGIASLTLASSAEAVGLAFAADSVAADNVPMRAAPAGGAQESVTSDTPTYKCKSTDSTSMMPKWHVHSSYMTPDGKRTIDSVKAGGIARFVTHVAGGNLSKFSEEVDVMYKPQKAVEVLKRGSRPAWFQSGGDPHWAIRNGLCHWKDSRTISFLIKVAQGAKPGRRLCVPYIVDGTTGYAKGGNMYDVSGTMHNCIRVK